MLGFLREINLLLLTHFSVVVNLTVVSVLITLTLWTAEAVDDVCTVLMKSGEYPVGLTKSVPAKLQDAGFFYEINNWDGNVTGK